MWSMRVMPQPRTSDPGGRWDIAASDPGLHLPGSTASGEVISAPGSSDAVDPGVVELGLLGYPGAPSLPVS
jgi:hypothetical protein